MKNNKLILTSALLLGSVLGANAQLVIDNTTQSPQQLVQNVLVGSGVTIMNVEFNNSIPLANVPQTMVGYFDATATTFPIPEGVVLATGNAIAAIGPNNSSSYTDNTGAAADPNDPDMAMIGSPYVQNNEAILEFDFIPTGDSVVFNYVFASEEYHEYSTSSFNDGFGFIISGPGFAGPFLNGGVNIAVIPGTGGLPVTMNNLNNGSSNTGPCTNCAYLVNNPTGSPGLQYDAHTVVMQAVASVECGQTYHIKLVIADAGDQAFDSAVFLEANSFSSNGVQVQIASATGSAAITEACDSAIVTFIRPEDQVGTALTIPYTIAGTATNGTDYPFLPGTITFPIGVDTVQFYVTPSADGFAEGTETVTLTVTIINECGDPVITTATIEIIDPLPFNVVPNDIVIDCPTPTVNITAGTAGGVPSFTYDWQGGSTSPSANVPGNIPGTTNYTVDITDACGTVASGIVSVTLNPAPVPTITFNQNTFVICPAEDATIIATVVNPYSAVTYDWAPTAGSTNTLTVSPNVLTWYYLTIDDGCYTVTDSVKVEMGGIDVTNITAVPATNCPGQPGTPGSITVLPDDPDFVYTLIGGGDTYGPQVTNIFPGLDGGIIYFLHVENADGCFIDTAVNVGLGANAVTATWMPGALDNVTCFGDLNGSAQVTNIVGGITPPYTVTWTHTSGLYDTQSGLTPGQGDAINNLMGGNWVVTATDQEGCAWSQLFSIFEPAELTLDFIYNDPSCYLFTDGSVTASTSGGNGGNIFTMTNAAGTQLNGGNSNTINNLGEGWYYTTIVDSEGCTTEDSVFVDQPNEMAIDLIIQQPLCYGFETGYAEVDTVYNYNGSYNNVAYFWNPNPSGINGIGAAFTNHLGPGTYALTINDENGCSKVFDFLIEYPDSLYFTEIGFEPAHCRTQPFQSGNGVVFAAAAGGTPDYDYLWTNNTTGVTTTNTTWGGLNPATYTMVVTDDNGCLLTETFVLDSVSPIAAFDVFSDQFLTAGLYEGTAVVCVEFTNQSQYFANPNDPNADTTFFWHLNFPNVGVLTDDYSQVFDTCYTSAGVYEVCLVAINKNDCKDTSCVELIIFDPLEFTPVNVFTPDGDGVNDTFTFNFWAQAVATFECIIVNRWGVTVHIMNDIADEWDGTDMSGSPLPDGIYFYTYTGVATNGDTFSGQGFTHIANSGL